MIHQLLGPLAFQMSRSWIVAPFIYGLRKPLCRGACPRSAVGAAERSEAAIFAKTLESQAKYQKIAALCFACITQHIEFSGSDECWRKPLSFDVRRR